MCPPKKQPERVQPNKKNKKRDDTLADQFRFVDLPFDLVIEVFWHLEPLDILHLARTTKALRTFLLDRQRAHSVWKTVIGNVPDFPPCPDHLSEPAYTHLAFDPVCHGCFEPCSTIEWELRMRCCASCFPEMTFRQCYPYPEDDVEGAAYSVDIPATSSHIELRDGGTEVVSVPLRGYSSCRRSDWDSLLDRLKCAKDRKKVVAEQDALWDSVREHAKLCREWEHKRLSEQATRLRLIRGERVNDIKSKLKALGWTDDIYYTAAFFQLPTVNRTVPLTSAEWSKISSELVASLPSVRLAHIAVIYRERLKLLTNTLPDIKDLKAKPNAIDFYLQPDVRDFLEGDINTEMTQAMVSQKFEPILHELMKCWCADAVDALASLAQELLGPDAHVDPANAVFQCTKCKEQMEFDRALSHGHLYPKHPKRKERKQALKEESEIYEEVGKELSESYPRRLDVLQVNKTASQTVDDWVKELGGRVFILPFRQY